MKSLFTGLVLILLFPSCSVETGIGEGPQSQWAQNVSMEALCHQLNANIISLQAIADVLNVQDYVQEVACFPESGDPERITMSFLHHDPVVLHTAKNVVTTSIPVIGIKRSGNGAWTWTLDGEQLSDGKAGVAPLLRIREGCWWVSCDDGESWSTWESTEEQEGSRNSMFSSFQQDEHFVSLGLLNGEILRLTKYNPDWGKTIAVHDIENIAVRQYQTVIYDNNDYSYTCADYLTSSSLGSSFDLPNGMDIPTDIDIEANSRKLEIADNEAFHCSRLYSLDLTSNRYTVFNLEGGKSYYYRVYKDGNPYLLLNYGKFVTTGAVRFLRIKANGNYGQKWLKNVRDIGGWNTAQNGRIRYGAIIRGAEPNHITDGVKTSYISKDGQMEFKSLGITAQLDLRGAKYADKMQGRMMDDISFSCIPLDLWFYRLNVYFPAPKRAKAFAQAIRQIITWLRDGRCIYIHCKGGCDRTGALCAIIEGICGVSENDICHDYELSRRNRSREYYLLKKGDDYDGDFKFAIEYIKGLVKYEGHIYVYYRGEYYDPEKEVRDYHPVPVRDPVILKALKSTERGSLQDCFRLLMELGGLTPEEMDELVTLLCV